MINCPYCEYFEDLDQAQEYKDQNNIDLPLDEISCDSSMFNGFFWIK